MMCALALFALFVHLIMLSLSLGVLAEAEALSVEVGAKST